METFPGTLWPALRPAVVLMVRTLEREHRHDIIEGGLIAVMPIGALWGIRIQMSLIDIGVRCLFIEPLANVIAALTQHGNVIFVKHCFDDPDPFFFISAADLAATSPFVQEPHLMRLRAGSRICFKFYRFSVSF